MYNLIFYVMLLSIPPHIVRGASTTKPISLTPHTNIKDRKFQTHFIVKLNELVDTAASDHLNRLLDELRTNKDYAVYTSKIESAASSILLVPKIVYLKQLLDTKLKEQAHSVETFYTLRNLNFLNKLKHQLLQLQDESAAELRHLRWYNLCRQFWFRDNLNQTKAPAHIETTPPQHTNYWSNVKLAPMRAKTVAATDTPPKAHIDIEHFGSTLYTNVKSAGSEIIDDYLLTVRKLLQEVVEEKHIASEEEEEEKKGAKSMAQNDESHALHATKLSKLLTEIDAILAIDDFYEKRNRLYAYLEKDLSADYEQFKNSQYAHEDLAVILAKLQTKGLDLFVTFIFSNFEFLEHLHETWAKLLPEPMMALQETQLQYDVMSQHLFDVNRLYVEFKSDWENVERYDAYQKVVKELYAETRNGSTNMHIFELLHNASANVGSVTMNMIKGKCDEF